MNKKQWNLVFLISLILSIVLLVFKFVGIYIYEESIKSDNRQVFEALEQNEPEPINSDEEFPIYSEQDQFLIDWSNNLLEPVHELNKNLVIAMSLSFLITIISYYKYNNSTE